MNLLTPTLPLYAAKIGGGPASSGLIVGVFALTALIFRPYVGALLDKRGRKIVLICGMVIFLFSVIMFNFAFLMVSLIIIRLIQGAGFSAASTTLGTIASDLVPSSRRAEGIGYFGMSNTIGMAIGPALGLFIVSHYNFHVLFIMTLVFATLAFAISLLLNNDHKAQEPALHNTAEKDKKRAKFTIDSILEKSSLEPCLVMLFLAISFSSILTFLPAYAASRGIKDIGMFYTVYAIAILLVRIFTGKFADRYGYSMVIIPSILLVSFSFILLIFAKSYPVFLLVAVLYGLGYGSAQPILNTIVIMLSPKARRGAANATYFSTLDIGIGGGAILWGFLSQNFGLSFVYGGAAVSAILSLAMYIFVLRKHLKKVVA